MSIEEEVIGIDTQGLTCILQLILPQEGLSTTDYAEVMDTTITSALEEAVIHFLTGNPACTVCVLHGRRVDTITADALDEVTTQSDDQLEEQQL